jgi:hypothetical protein
MITRKRFWMAAAAGLWLALTLQPPRASACVPCADYNFLCCDIPADNLFYLTSFSGEGMACGGYADGAWYYSTSWVRWYCDAKLSITNPDTGECVVVQVADAGPASWVEETAGMPIVDASPLVCDDLFGSSSCGWSDRFVIEVHQVPDGTPTGRGACVEPGPDPDAEEPQPDEVIEETPAVEEPGIEAIEETGPDVSEDPGVDPGPPDLVPDASPEAITDVTPDPNPDGGLYELPLEGGCACSVPGTS